jgi:ABC-type uncharacterized transport system ATPase subunit
MRIQLALLLSCLLSTSALATPYESWREARIRPQDARLADLLRAGVARSATFREIVNQLEAGNVIVYVTLSPNMRASLAGKLTWMTQAGTFRYVRATINTEQSADQMIATLAHELQHALEVSDDITVIDQRSLLGLYQRIGRPSVPGVNAGWETVAAEETGFQVRRELAASTATASAVRANRSTQS